MEFCLYSEDENLNNLFHTKDFEVAMQLAEKDYGIKIYSQENFVTLVNCALNMLMQIQDMPNTFSIIIPNEVLTSNQNLQQ